MSYAARQLTLPDIAALDAVNACTPPEVAAAGDSCMVAHAVNGGGCIHTVPGHATRPGRKPVHADAAARKAAYRADRARIDYTDAPHIVAELRETAAELDCGVNELLQSMVRFAQCNRNWKTAGLYMTRSNGAPK